MSAEPRSDDNDVPFTPPSNKLDAPALPSSEVQDRADDAPLVAPIQPTSAPTTNNPNANRSLTGPSHQKTSAEPSSAPGWSISNPANEQAEGQQHAAGGAVATGGVPAQGPPPAGGSGVAMRGSGNVPGQPQVGSREQEDNSVDCSGPDADGERADETTAASAGTGVTPLISQSERQRRQEQGRKKRSRAHDVLQQMQDSVTVLENNVQALKARRALLQSTGLSQLHALMPSFFEQHASVTQTLITHRSSLRQALRGSAIAMLAPLNESIMQEERLLSCLRIDAANKGCTLVLLCGVGPSAMGKPLLETTLGDIPLDVAMRHFIDAHSSAMDSDMLALCKQLLEEWQVQERRLRMTHAACAAAAQCAGQHATLTSMLERLSQSGDTFVLKQQAGTEAEGEAATSGAVPATAPTHPNPSRASTSDAMDNYRQYAIAREIHRIRELWGLKAQLPDSAFSYFLTGMWSICDAFDATTSTMLPVALSEHLTTLAC